MREPSTATDLFDWHRRSLAGEQPPIHEADPQCGYFATRLYARGPFIAARIWVEQTIDWETGELQDDEVWRCEIAGEPRDPHYQWPYLAKRPISYEEFRWLTARLPLLRKNRNRSSVTATRR